MSRIKDAADAVARAIIAQRDYLTELDREIGDGDHGINMARGFTAAEEAVDALPDTTKPGPVLDAIGRALIENVGGAAGPLFGTAFRRAAAACDEETGMTAKSFETLLTAAVDGIRTRGRAKAGDKTILDALIPIRDAFRPKNAADKRLFEILADALRAGREGVAYTKTIVAKKGRASLIGERSIGHEDPGAMSVLILYRALYQFLRK